MDSTVFIARVIFGGVLERSPASKICVTHGGGYLPVLPGALRPCVRGQRRLPRAHPRPPSTYLAQMYFDTMVFEPEAIASLVERWGADHVLLGTDYPFDMGETDPLGLLARVANLDGKDRGLIAGGNAARLLRLDR